MVLVSKIPISFAETVNICLFFGLLLLILVEFFGQILMVQRDG